MEKTFLKFLPVAAAVLLATSCSKDNDGDNSVIDNPATPVENNETAEHKSEPLTMTFTVSASANLSKIGIADGAESGATVNPKFEVGDVIKFADASNLVTADVTLTTDQISADGKSANFTVSSFSGTEDDLSKFRNGEIKLTATMGGDKLTDIDNNSYTSLEAAIRAKSSQMSDEISYSAEKVTLTFTEQNAYLEVFMSPDQHVVTINGNDYTMDANGKVWIAVGVGANVSANFLKTKTIKNAKVYTIDRTGFVDLGITDGTLWADANVTGTTSDDKGTYKEGYGWYYTFDDAQNLGVTLPTGGSSTTYNPSYPNTDCKNLNDQCYWEKVMDGSNFKGYNVFKKKSGDSPTYSADSDPHIFLPAAGCCRGGDGPSYAGSRGLYWSSTVFNGSRGFDLYFNSGSVGSLGIDDRDYEFPVRAVRCK